MSNNNITLNKLIKSISKYNPKTKTYFSFALAARNTFYKYEYEHKICLPYMLQTGFCKSVIKILRETLKARFMCSKVFFKI